MWLNDKKRLLLENTIFLYIWTFSNNLLNLILIPYQTRVLGPSIYGRIGVAVSIMAYLQIFLDFGFILSATAKVTQNRGNIEKIKRILTNVTTAKGILSIISGIVLYAVCINIENLEKDLRLYFLYWAAYTINAFLPDFIYRGMEQMKWITFRTLIVRIVFLIFTIITVKKPEDYWKIPILLMISNLIAIIMSYVDIYKKWNITFSKINIGDTWMTIKETFPFFISRFASSFYQALNTIILGVQFSGQNIVGYYTASDKLVNLAKTCSSPVADSIYPYMIKNKDFKLVKKILIFVMPFLLSGGITLFIFAEQIGVLCFGVEYQGIGKLIRCMLPVMVVIFPTYLLAFPVMVPLGLSKYANMSNVFGAFIQIIVLTVIWSKGIISIYTLALASCLSELGVFLFRLLITGEYLIKHKHKYQS